mgnify:CR=1 FL=1
MSKDATFRVCVGLIGLRIELQEGIRRQTQDLKLYLLKLDLYLEIRFACRLAVSRPRREFGLKLLDCRREVDAGK